MKTLLALAAAIAVLSLAGAPAQAQSFREIMEDIGLQKRKQEKMDFSERAPLVLPPSYDLPPPEEGGALAKANPNWPNDPDDVRALEEAEREKVPQHLRRKYRENAAKDIYKIRAQEREAGTAASTSRAYDTTFDRDKVMSPSELKEVRDNRAAQPVQAYVEPERARLTDPPAGYRSPSPSQPFGPGEKEQKKKNSLFSKLNPFD
jgi:hypothetical protein